ncbi:YceI family protein [Candidatus Binatus sp.]|uniref:YceI family protein n=1 Tax=Candidatus Binatus sp. TaxID=2811406 RepID=UPI002F94A36B
MAAFVHQAAAAQLRSGTLELDPSKTLIEFHLPGALHTTHGTFKLEHGIIKADPATGEAGGSIIVDAKSGDSGLSSRDNRMKDSVLEVQKYPQITFAPGHVTGQLGTDGQFQAKLQGVLTLHGAGHQIVMEVRGRLVGNSLIAKSHFSVPYVDWGLKDPSILLLTVAKQVDIDIATAGHVVWTRDQARGSNK